MHVTALKLRDRDFADQWPREIEDQWEYADFIDNPHWRKDWISFDCLCHEPATDTVFAGITSFDADIFWGWNRKERKWVDAGYARIRDRYDAKFHRALLRNPKDDCLYAAPALLHDIDRFWEAPGAAFIRYNPATGDIAKLGIPLPHQYMQSMALDAKRQILYGQTFTPENLVSCDLNTGELRWIGPTSSAMVMAQGQNILVDSKGRVWGAWHVTRAWQMESGCDAHRLFYYDPETEKIQYLPKGLPKSDGAHGTSKAEAFFDFRTGPLYVADSAGALYRMDPETADAEYLFQPVAPPRPSRLSAMALAPDGQAYAIVGRDGDCELMRFDPQSEKYEIIGPVQDSATGARPYQIHDICCTPDGTLYAGENDNPFRSSYLWEIVL